MKTAMVKMVRNAVGKPRRSLAVAAVAVVSVLATTTFTTAAWVDDEWAAGTVGVGSPGDCTTNTLFSSEASARQLSGSVLGVNLDSIAGIEGLRVTNNGSAVLPDPATATSVAGVPDAFISKLPVTALGSNPVTAALALGVPVSSVGAFTQWAQAQSSGQTRAAAGLVTDQSGAVDVAGTAAGTFTAPQAATVSLGNILPASLAGVTLNVGAVASSASVQGCAMVSGWPTLAEAPGTREYGVASLDLSASVPAVGALSRDGTSVVGTIPGRLDSLVAPGALTAAISSELTSLIGPVLGTLDSSASTTATLSAPDLRAVDALMAETLVDDDGTMVIDPAAGTVRVDVAALTGGTMGLNGRAPNHSALGSSLAGAVADKVAGLLDQWRLRVLGALVTALRDVTIESRSVVTVLNTLGVPVAEIIVEAGASKLGDFLDGRAVGARVTPSLLGLGIGGALLDSVVGTLTSGANGAVQNALRQTIFDAGLMPAMRTSVDSLATHANTNIDARISAVSSLVSIHVNVQPDQPWPGVKPADVSARSGESKVSAVRIGLINDPELLSLSLGTSSAGPINYRTS